MADESVPINVCLLPTAAASARLVEFAESLPGNEQLFRIDGVDRLAHLTVFSSLHKRSMIDELIERLHHLPSHANVECAAFGITVSSNGYVEIGYNKTSELQELQRTVAAAIADLRDVDLLKTDASMSKVEAFNQRTVGSRLYGATYRPHVTLAAYNDPKQLSLPVATGFASFDFQADSWTVAEGDAYGCVRRVLKTVPLA